MHLQKYHNNIALFAIKIVNPPVDTTGIDQKRQFMETRGQGWTQWANPRYFCPNR